jgi:myosin heavy subunit
MLVRANECMIVWMADSSSNVKALQQEISSLKQLLSQQESERFHLVNQIKAFQSEFAYQDRELSREKTNFESNLLFQRNQTQELIKQLQDKQTNINNLSSRVAALEKENSEYKAQINKLKFKLADSAQLFNSNSQYASTLNLIPSGQLNKRLIIDCYQQMKQSKQLKNEISELSNKLGNLQNLNQSVEALENNYVTAIETIHKQNGTIQQLKEDNLVLNQLLKSQLQQQIMNSNFNMSHETISARTEGMNSGASASSPVNN